MKASTWKTILQIAISFLTAIATTLGITEGTFGCRRLIREVIRDLGWREDFAAEETAALFRFFYLFLVAEAAIVSLAEDPVFLLLFFTSVRDKK